MFVNHLLPLYSLPTLSILPPSSLPPPSSSLPPPSLLPPSSLPPPSLLPLSSFQSPESPKPQRGRSHTTNDDYIIPPDISLPAVPSSAPPSALESLSKTMNPEEQRANVEDLRAMGVQEVTSSS